MELSQLLLLAGGAGIILYALFAGVRAIQKRAGIPFLGFLIVAASALLPLASLSMGSPMPQARTLTALFAVVLLGAGVLVSLIERAKQQTKASASFGLVGAGAGVLMLVGTFAAPRVVTTALPVVLSTTNSLSAPAVQAAGSGDTQLIASFDSSSASSIILSTPIPAQVREEVSPTPTPTPFYYVQPTPSSAAQNVSAESEADAAAESSAPALACDGTNANNLNLREGAGKDFALLTTLPYGTVMTVRGTNTDATWLAVDAAGQRGWVSAEYVTLGTHCADLPVVES